MMKKIMLTVTMMVILFAGTWAQKPTTEYKNADKNVELMKKWLSAYQAGDWNTMRSYCSESTMVYRLGGIDSMDLDQQMSYWQESSKNAKPSISNDIWLPVYGDNGYTVGEWVLHWATNNLTFNNGEIVPVDYHVACLINNGKIANLYFYYSRDKINEALGFETIPPEGALVDLGKKGKYQILKKGDGISPMEGDEIGYKIVFMNPKREVLFNSRTLGFIWHATFNDSIAAVVREAAVHTKAGGKFKAMVPKSDLPKGARNQLEENEEYAILQYDLLEVKPLRPSGAEKIAGVLKKEGSKSARAQYKALRADDSYTMYEQDFNNLGYEFLNDEDVDHAIFMLSLATELFPDSWNVWDSLGEAYMKKGDKANAKKYYKKCLTLNPEYLSALDALKKLNGTQLVRQSQK